MIREKSTTGVSGVGVFAAALVGLVVAGALLRDSAGEPGRQWLGVGVALVAIAVLPGLVMVNPNEGRVLQLFGDYVGTLRLTGLRWVNPLFTKRRVSLRVRNFETQSRMKVNDIDGNPIEMSAVVVWHVVDTAQATFEVDDCEKFVTIAAEAALRKLAMSYPYDAHEEGQVSLRGSPIEITEHLRSEMQERLALAGVEVLEARISNLAYAPEIAQAMLRRQQATAVIAARQKIVDGSVGMVEMALERLSQKNIVTLDEERKAAMVSNLLVVLCSESSTQPIINTGTLYQ
ncbi:MAG TPA: SPFH domain-containing protein [Polyangiaceae bacterium]|nr:SPFH domain-containing protein [Polyangiaceae bacterium]